MTTVTKRKIPPRLEVEAETLFDFSDGVRGESRIAQQRPIALEGGMFTQWRDSTIQMHNLWTVMAGFLEVLGLDRRRGGLFVFPTEGGSKV